MPLLLQTLDEQLRYLIGSLHVQVVAQAVEIERLRAEGETLRQEVAQAHRDLAAVLKDA